MHGHGHGHSHGLVHDSIKRSRAGIRAVALALLVLGVTALAQALVFAASGSVAADYVVVQMYAAAASGQSTPEDAVREAERRARRYYR